MLFIDDYRHLRAVTVGEKFAQRGAAAVQKRLHDRLVNERIVRRDAGLTGVEHLAEHHAARGQRNIGGFVHNHGAFAAELQRERGQVRGRALHDRPSDRWRTGEENIVEALMQQRLIFGSAALNHRDVLGRENLAQQRGQRAACVGRVSGRLNYGAVTRRNCADQRLKAKLDGVVPRRKNQHHAVWLGRDKADGGKLRKRRFDAFFARPRAEPAQMIANFIQHKAGFGHIDLKRGFSEICGHGGSEFRLMRLYCAVKRLQCLSAVGNGARFARTEEGALRREKTAEIGFRFVHAYTSCR